MKPVLGQLGKRTSAQHRKIVVLSALGPPVLDPIPISEEADKQDGAFFCERYRNRRPKESYKKGTYEPGGTCNKKSPWASGMSPGVLILSCEHRVVHGYYFLKEHESPAHAARVFLDRFKQSEMEGLRVIYDNGCHLQRWCLAREAPFFAKTQFFIDRLHWCGHIACQPSLDMDTYIYSPDIMRINSQAVEQINSTLKGVRKTIAGMRVDHAVDHLKEFFWRHNLEQKGP